MTTIGKILNQSAVDLAKIQRNDYINCALEVRLLFQHVLGVDHAWLIGHINDELTATQSESFQQLLARRLAGEPIAYILGMREFYGLPLKTTPATLIPRPDTETLVEAALNKIAPHENLKVLDLGTGTGAIALVIAKNRPQAQVIAVDFSDEALFVAKENALNLDLVRVRFLQSDWFASLQNEKFDVIVSNPPYIAENDAHLTQGDLRFEPLTALASGKDGLDDIRHIIQEAPSHLNRNGWLMLEHGFDQAEKVAELLTLHGFEQISHATDLSGTLRVTLGRMPQ
jgi:release factor glutamine methyltransferase